MDYRIEKREAFQVIAKRASYEGSGEIASKNIHNTWETCIKDGTIQTLAGYVNPENVLAARLSASALPTAKRAILTMPLRRLIRAGLWQKA